MQDSWESTAPRGQAVNGGAGCRPSQGSANGSVHRIQVPRRLNDQVLLSRESSGQEESAMTLCSNFMAAWG